MTMLFRHRWLTPHSSLNTERSQRGGTTGRAGICLANRLLRFNFYPVGPQRSTRNDPRVQSLVHIAGVIQKQTKKILEYSKVQLSPSSSRCGPGPSQSPKH